MYVRHGWSCARLNHRWSYFCLWLQSRTWLWLNKEQIRKYVRSMLCYYYSMISRSPIVLRRLDLWTGKYTGRFIENNTTTKLKRGPDFRVIFKPETHLYISRRGRSCKKYLSDPVDSKRSCYCNRLLYCHTYLCGCSSLPSRCSKFLRGIDGRN